MLLSVESVERASAHELMCTVRCLDGTVALGNTFDAVEADGRSSVAVSLLVTQMYRYEDVAVKFIDPPHGARIVMAGTGAQAVVRGTRLRG